MSTLSINKEAAKINGLTIQEVLYMLCLANSVDPEECSKFLVKKGFITADRNDLFQPVGWRLTQNGMDRLESVLIDSEKSPKAEDQWTDLARRLKEIFPQGKKPGTNFYWSDGVALIKRRLKLFFKKYGDLYTEDEIVEAAKKYVEGFNGSYQYMRLLKYFIFKEVRGVNGEVEGTSELINYIENKGQEDALSLDWTSTLN